MLHSFISFWRAAAIVLADLGSTAFYVAGIVEQAIGKSAPSERHGRGVTLLVQPATNIFDAVAPTAVRLRASEIVVGESAVLAVEDQAHQMGGAWDGRRTTAC